MSNSYKKLLRTLPVSTKGPVAMVFAEDEIGLKETLDHLTRLQFGDVVVLGQTYATQNIRATSNVHILRFDPDQISAIGEVLTAAASVFEGRWIYHCYNAEFLYFPFCETRTISDFTGFLDEERRNNTLGYTIDLYPEHLPEGSTGFDLETAHFDLIGYYALNRRSKDGMHDLDKQIDVFGGLRWRFLQYVPWERRQIGKTIMFKGRSGVRLNDDLVFSEEEYETLSTPWHNSPTVANCSFRAAKYLRFNPDSRKDVQNFMWSRSQKFDHNSEQLMEMGMMEPGQWF